MSISIAWLLDELGNKLFSWSTTKAVMDYDRGGETGQTLQKTLNDLESNFSGDMKKEEFAANGQKGVVDKALEANKALSAENGINIYTHSKEGTVHNFQGEGSNGKALLTANFAEGDTITVNGSPVTAYMGTEEAISSMAGNEWNGKWITFVVDGDTLNFKGGGSKVTVSGLSAAVVKSGTTVTVKQGEKTITEVTGTLKAEERPVEYSFFNVQSHRYGGHSGTSYPENWNNTVIPGTYRAIYQTSILYRGFDAYFNINGSRAVNGKNYSFPNGSCNVSGGRGSNTHDDVEGACAMASLRLIKID